MADFSHLSVVSSEIRSNTPSSVKHEESQEPATLNTNFLSRETPFGAIALPGENETEPEPTLAVISKEEQKANRAKLFAEIDTDGDGKINIQEALVFGMDRATFRDIDANGDGNLSKKEIKRWLSSYLSKKELQEIAKEEAKLKKEAEKIAKSQAKQEEADRKAELKRMAKATKAGSATSQDDAWIHEQNAAILAQQAAAMNDSVLSDGSGVFVGEIGTNISDQPPWLWVPCEKAAANAAIKAGRDGEFLVRESSKPGSYVLMVTDQNVMQQLQIIPEGTGYKIGPAYHASLEALIEAMQTKSPLLSKAESRPGREFFITRGIPLPGYAVSSRPVSMSVSGEAQLAATFSKPIVTPGMGGAAPASWGVPAKPKEEADSEKTWTVPVPIVVQKRNPTPNPKQPKSPAEHKPWNINDDEAQHTHHDEELGFEGHAAWEDHLEKRKSVAFDGVRPDSMMSGFERRLSTYSGFGDEFGSDAGEEAAIVVSASIITQFKRLDPYDTQYLSIRDFHLAVVQNGHYVTQADLDESTRTVANDRIFLEDFAARLKITESMSASNIRSIIGEPLNECGGMLPAMAIHGILLKSMGCDVDIAEFGRELTEYERDTALPADILGPVEAIFVIQSVLKRWRARTFAKFDKFDAALVGTLAPTRCHALMQENKQPTDATTFKQLLEATGYSASQQLSSVKFVLAYETLVLAQFQNLPSIVEAEDEVVAAAPVQAEITRSEPQALVQEPVQEPAVAVIEPIVTSPEDKKRSFFAKFFPGAPKIPKPPPTVAVGLDADPVKNTDTERFERHHDLKWESQKVNEQVQGPFTGMQTSVDVKAQPIVRAADRQKMTFDVRKVNEQVLGPETGQKTKMTIEAEALKREQKAQKLVGMGQGGNTAPPAQSRGGKFERDAQADVSYFNGKERFAEPGGMLQYDVLAADAQTIIPLAVGLNAELMSPFYHPYLHTKAETNVMLKQAASDGCFLVRPERHGSKDTPCLSVIMRGKVTHHILTAKPGGDYTVSCFPFATKNYTLINCKTIPHVLETLRVATSYWKAPLTMGVTPAHGDVQAYIDETAQKQEEDAYNRALTNQPTMPDHDITNRSSPFVIVNSRAFSSQLSPEKKAEAKKFSTRRMNSLASHENNKQPEIALSAGVRKRPPPQNRLLVQQPTALVSSGFVGFNATTTSSSTSRHVSRSASRVSERFIEEEPVAIVSASTVPLPTPPVKPAEDPSIPPFHHGDIEKKMAEDILFADDGAKDTGRYLFRDAKGKSDEFILSVVYKGKGTHHSVATNAAGFLTINKLPSAHTSYPEFIAFLGSKQKSVKWPVPLTTGVENSSKALAWAQAQEQYNTALGEANATNAKINAATAAATASAPAPAPAPAPNYAKKKEPEPTPTEEWKGAGTEDLLFTRSRQASSRAWEVKKVNEQVKGTGEVATLPVEGVEFARTRLTQNNSFAVKKQFSNITGGAAKHNMGLDGEKLDRERKVQAIASEQLRFDHVTGEVGRSGGADAVSDRHFQDDGKQGFKRLQTADAEIGFSANRVELLQAAVPQQKYVKQGISSHVPFGGFTSKVSLKERMFALDPGLKGVAAKSPEIVADEEVAAPALSLMEQEALAAVAAAAPAPVEVPAVAAQAAPLPSASPELAAPSEAKADQAPLEEEETSGGDGGTKKVQPFAYLHQINKARADELLLADGGAVVSGKFLIRQAGEISDIEPDEAILSVVYKGNTTHHAISRGKGGAYTLNKRQSECTTLEQLCTYCKEKQKSIGWPVPLVLGVARA